MLKSCQSVAMALPLLHLPGKRSPQDLCPVPRVVMLLVIAAALETSLAVSPPWNVLHVCMLSQSEVAAHGIAPVQTRSSQGYNQMQSPLGDALDTVKVCSC